MLTAPNIYGISQAEASALVETLTPRERQVAECVALGLPFEHIVDHLGIARKTFDLVLARVRDKLGVTNHGVARVWYASMGSGT